MITSAIPPSAVAIPQVPSSFLALHFLLPFPVSPPVCTPLWLWWQVSWTAVTFGERTDCHCRFSWISCDPVQNHLGCVSQSLNFCCHAFGEAILDLIASSSWKFYCLHWEHIRVSLQIQLFYVPVIFLK